MQKVSVSLRDEHTDVLKRRQDEGDADSRSEALRQILDEYEDLHTEYETLEAECEELHTRCERREDRIDELEQQLARRSEMEEKIEALPDKIREAASYSERRQRLLDEASLAQRIKWKVTGVPVDDLEDTEDVAGEAVAAVAPGEE